MDGRSGLADRRGNDSSSGVHFVSVGVIAFVPSKLTAWENCSEWVDGIGVRRNIRLNRLYCSSSRRMTTRAVIRRLSFPSSFSSSFYHGRMMKQHLVNTWLVDNDLTLRFYSKSKKYNRWKFFLVDLLNS